MKVMIVSNTTWNIYNFRMNLADTLRDRGFQVVAVGVADGYEENIRQLGYEWAEWKFTRRSMNPFSELGAVNNLRRVYRQHRPDIVQHFTIKPVWYGTIAARLARVPAVINSITGLPYIMTSRSDGGLGGLAKRASMTLYAKCCMGPKRRALFQNPDDVAMLAKYAPQIADDPIMLPGSGVDLERFAHTAPPELKERKIRIVCVARLIREKGVFDLVEAARIIGESRNDVEFLFCGSPDHGNRSSVDAETFEQWKRQPNLIFPGHVEDVPTELRASDIVVLPSYREGTPRSLLEAAAIGRPIVSTQVPGCRETVDDGVTGFLVPPRSPVELAEAITKLIDDPDLRAQLGRAGRKKAESKFDERFVIERTLEVYSDLLGHPLSRPSG